MITVDTAVDCESHYYACLLVVFNILCALREAEWSVVLLRTVSLGRSIATAICYRPRHVNTLPGDVRRSDLPLVAFRAPLGL